MAVHTTACHPAGTVKTYSCTADVWDLLLTYSDASQLSLVDLSSCSLAVSLVSLETASGTAVVIDLLTIIPDSNFDAPFYNIQVKSMTCCQKISDFLAKKHKH